VADGLEEFQEKRSRMFGIAYRMLGSVTDAEEVLQEAWLRGQSVDHSQVTDPAAFLARTVTNLCLNLLTSARARREVYVGPWLPEPVLTDLGEAGRLDDLGPLEVATQQETIVRVARRARAALARRAGGVRVAGGLRLQPPGGRRWRRS
jgi:DNA-directed RNA polymerase specialized sigma24 family protein